LRVLRVIAMPQSCEASTTGYGLRQQFDGFPTSCGAGMDDKPVTLPPGRETLRSAVRDAKAANGAASVIARDEPQQNHETESRCASALRSLEL